jgi:hypothetical protein
MTESNGHSPDQISFYDETLKKQIEGCYRYDGKAIHVASQAYGARSARANITPVDQNAVDSFAQKLLCELAHDAEKDMQSH